MTNIAITIDDNYAQHACVMLESLKSNHKDPVTIYCIYDRLSDINLTILKDHFSKTSISLIFKQFDSSVISDMPIKAGSHVSIATYFRILLPEILEDLDEVVFLDSDIVITDDLSGLLNADISGYPVAAAEDLSLTDALKAQYNISKGFAYFNAGILKMNLKYFRDNNLTKKILNFINEFPEKCVFWDQDALNNVIRGHFSPLALRFNILPPYFESTSNTDLLSAIKDPAIVHFSGGGNCKPWFYYNNHPYKKFYYLHLKNTPFADYREPDRPDLPTIIKEDLIKLVKRLYRKFK